MKKQILFIVSLLLILGLYSSQTNNKSSAQSQENTPIPDFPPQNQTNEIPESIAYEQLFRMINSFEKEARKQEGQGFKSRAETLRGTFREMLRLDNQQFGKLKEASSNFSDKASRLKLKAKKLNGSKSSKAKKSGEMEKIEKEYKQLPLMYRDSLQRVLGKQDFELFAKSVQEKIAAKMTRHFDTVSHLLFVGYSTISYNSSNGEIIGYSATPNEGYSCDLEEGHYCIGTGVYAVLSSDAQGTLDADSSETCNTTAEVYLYYSDAAPAVRYCVNANHLYDDSSYCSFQGGGISSTSENCLTTPPPPNVTGVSFQNIAPNSTPIDTNPNIGGGLRIFPDDNTPMENANRQTIRVSASISEARAGQTVYFRSFDVDDPSTDMTIDPNGNTENDNNGRVNNLREGQLSAVSAPTNSNGIATVNFTVTMQPGDNFAIAASTSSNERDGVSVSGTDLVNGSGQTIQTACDSTDTVCRSEMLTVWRRLHIEVDSMGEAQGNFVLGNVSGNVRVKPNQTATITVNTANQLEPNRFEGGRIVIGSDSLPVSCDIANGVDCNTTNTVRVYNPGSSSVNISANTQFQLFDDDDFNDDDGTNVDGDTGEDVEEKPQTFSLMRNSDSVAENAYAAAYIRPEYNWAFNQGYDQNNINFGINLNYDVENPVDVQLLYSYLNSLWDSYEEYDDFWSAYVFLAYQPAEIRDNDPNSSTGRGGDTLTVPGNADSPPPGPFPVGGNHTLVYLETCRDIDKEDGTPEFETSTAAHEIGHQMGLKGDESGFGIMSSGETLVFVPTHINMLRKRVHSPGY